MMKKMSMCPIKLAIICGSQLMSDSCARDQHTQAPYVEFKAHLGFSCELLTTKGHWKRHPQACTLDLSRDSFNCLMSFRMAKWIYRSF